jgi:hypothetical protein
MAWCDQPKPKGADIADGIGDDLLIAAGKVKTTNDRIRRD